MEVGWDDLEERVSKLEDKLTSALKRIENLEGRMISSIPAIPEVEPLSFDQPKSNFHRQMKSASFHQQRSSLSNFRRRQSFNVYQQQLSNFNHTQQQPLSISHPQLPLYQLEPFSDSQHPELRNEPMHDEQMYDEQPFYDDDEEPPPLPPPILNAKNPVTPPANNSTRRSRPLSSTHQSPPLTMPLQPIQPRLS